MPSKTEGLKPRDRKKKGNNTSGSQSCYNNKSIRIREMNASNSNKKKNKNRNKNYN